MVKSIRLWVAAALLAALAFCLVMRYGIHTAKQSVSETSQTISSSVQASSAETVSAVSDNTVREKEVTESSEEEEVTESPEEKEVTEGSEEKGNSFPQVSEPDASVRFITEQKVNEITEKMQKAARYSSDLIGWIYIADSEIDYPVVQGTDDQYYLHHAPDGSDNHAGSIFLSYRCAADFSGALHILYGHDMQRGMFSDIRNLRQREQFDKHRYGWLFTKEDLYRIDFYALSVVSAYDALYDIPADNSRWQETLKANSIYYNEPELNSDDSVLALSTCTYDFENARALFTGKLIWIQKIDLG